MAGIILLEEVEMSVLEQLVTNEERELTKLKDLQKEIRVNSKICKWGSILGLAATAVGAALYWLGGPDTEEVATTMMSYGGPIGGLTLLAYGLSSFGLKRKKFAEISEREEKLEAFKDYLQRVQQQEQRQEYTFYHPN